MNEITKEQFEKYLKVQKSRITNMFDIKKVSILTGLNKEQILYIMDNYSELYKEFEVEE